MAHQIIKRTDGPGPLESYVMAGHCEMCGANSLDSRRRALIPKIRFLRPAENSLL